jgi:hypothetical protein
MEIDWVEHWDGSGGDDHGLKVVTDSYGDVYVMGKSWNGSDYDYVILKYDGDTHALRWQRVYDRGHEDTPRDMVVSGNYVYVTGESWNGTDYDFLTLRLGASTGGVSWYKTYDDGKDDEGWGIAVDSGNVYVTGESRQLVLDDCVTICYDAVTGAREWVATYDTGLNNYGTCIAVDTSGDIYVGGSHGRSATGMNFLCVKYNSAGTEQWAKYEDGTGTIESDPDMVWDIAVSASTVYVTGQLNGYLRALDYGTTAYRTSDGYERWTEYYDGGESGNDKANAITIGADGSIWVTGIALNSLSHGQSCITTVRYDVAGNELCVDTHCSGMQNVAEEGRDIDVDASGNVWVAGRLNNSMHNYDCAVTEINTGCSHVWSDTYDREGSDDGAYGIAVHGDVVFVTGETTSGGDTDITTIKYADVTVVETITAHEPSGGESWYIGTKHDITWTSEGIATVKIEYTTDSGSPNWHTITSSTPSDGSYTWEVALTGGSESEDCRIRVSDASDGDPNDITDADFEIYSFQVTRDAFGFSDDSHHSGPDDQIWPEECWENYGVYPYTEWGEFDWEERVESLVDAWAFWFEGFGGPAAWPAGSAFPSWPMFVEEFGLSTCYFDPPPGDVVFKPSAVYYWMYTLPKMHVGSCFGFAAISALIFDELVPLSSYFPGYSRLYDVPLGDCSMDSAKMMTNRFIARMYGAQHRAYVSSHVLTTGPTETLNDVKAMLGDEARDHTCISLWARFLQMGHYDVPIRVEQHPTDPDIEYIYVYENFHAGVDTCRFEINTATDSWTYIATWFDPVKWSGQGKRLFLTDDASTFLEDPLLPHEYEGEVHITSSPGAYASFHTAARGIAEPVSGYASMASFSFEDLAWSCEFDSLQAGPFGWAVFTDEGNVLCYRRDDVEEDEQDEMVYAGDGQTVTVLNPRAGSRAHDMTGLGIHTSDETVCRVEGITVTPGDSIRYRVTSDGGLRIDNFGSSTGYDLHARIVDVTGEERFLHEAIDIPATTRHTIWLNWPTHADELRVDIDYGIDGSLDETMWLVNQVEWASVPGDGTVPESLVSRAMRNPFRGRTTIEYFLPMPADVTVDVCDVAGRRVIELETGPRTQGWHRATWNAGGLTSGVYFLRVRAAGEETTLKLVLLR